MNLSQAQANFAAILSRLIMHAAGRGLSVKICELYRTLEKQKEYVAAGKSKTLNSKHLSGLAADLAIICSDGSAICSGEMFRDLGEHWETLGGRWGGRFGVEPADYQKKLGWDSCHFEAKL